MKFGISNGDIEHHMSSLKKFPTALPGLRGNNAKDAGNHQDDHNDIGSFGPGQGSRAEDRANEVNASTALLRRHTHTHTHTYTHTRTHARTHTRIHTVTHRYT